LRDVAGVGLQWSNLDAVSSVDDNFTMSHTLIMLAVDIVFYTLVTWYFDALLPGDFGTPQPFYFPFTVFLAFLLLYIFRDVKHTPGVVAGGQDAVEKFLSCRKIFV